MPMARRRFVQIAATAPLFASRPVLGAEPSADDSLRSNIRLNAGLLGLPGFVAGVVREGKLSLVQADGFADLESRTPMRQDHIFYVASLTKTFTAVMMMQYVQEKKISLDDYLLDYPFLSVGFTADRLFDPNVTLKHVLSHTSEGKPGDNFVYNGGRYNFVYGVFEKISGNTNNYKSHVNEFNKRIKEPLGLTSTLPGHPPDAKDLRIPRIVTSYALDGGRKTLKKDAGVSGATNLYPGTGLLSTVDDLAKYMIALDENRLITSESYAHITTPYILNDGRLSQYGLGWSTQKVGGHAVHWHYGFDDPYSALLVRLPEKKTSFIFLSNTGAACAPFLLGWGANVLTSSFAVAFLDSELPGVLSDADRDYSRMFLTHYTEGALGRNPGEAKRLLGKLRSTEPARFRKNDRVMISILSDLSNPAFSEEMDSLVAAYRGSGDFHPDISLAIANYYGKTGKPAKRDVFLRQIADHMGYEGGATRDACVKLGAELLRSGKTEEGRKYLWRVVRDAQTKGEKVESQERLVQALKP
ncbi:serine hydrolase domain-containing protein [Singulisphaera acidiphila]|uniref:Penicillin-binding protein, beta-lactamase class C n=1 Tax=Singulisphaera acidiphila (strain ATCC BAA-1392 / DSM 18658 / VKM B-2454 / MOB10) TaxID=886293 RepID=L0DH09_SINAD|nr:serine hydrolase domain-containing protein [Singulisphaera acidiphila]AGA28547.1 penicillin-binding protein, beta-lactamase class C [Singulisphaera acidiphila DSM 18658]